MQAVVDRISENIAVLLLGDEETEVHMPVHLLPENIKEGTWLQIEFSIDENLTSKRTESNRELLEKIKRRNRK